MSKTLRVPDKYPEAVESYLKEVIGEELLVQTDSKKLNDAHIGVLDRLAVYITPQRNTGQYSVDIDFPKPEEGEPKELTVPAKDILTQIKADLRKREPSCVIEFDEKHMEGHIRVKSLYEFTHAINSLLGDESLAIDADAYFRRPQRDRS